MAGLTDDRRGTGAPASDLDLPVSQVRGVGARRAASLAEAEVRTVADLLYRVPRRYLDRSRVTTVAEAAGSGEVTLLVEVRSTRWVPGRRPRFVLVAGDVTGALTCTWFHGGRYLERTFSAGDRLALSGRVDLHGGDASMTHPEYEFVDPAGEGPLLHTGTVVPLYASSAEMKERGLRSRGFRRLVRAALDDHAAGLVDPLPEAVRQRRGLLPLAEALERVHFPRDLAEAAAARRRLAFDELFGLQLALIRRRRAQEAAPGIACPASRRLVPGLLGSLPFELTGGQRRALDEIAADMARPHPMRRLLQGDVGSGKTLVALCAALGGVEAGFQAAIMAPTEILAEQHFERSRALLEPLGVRCALIVGGQSAPLRRELLTAIAAAQVDVVFGTHALIQRSVHFDRLGLAVVDEQHRFGVEQRAELRGKGEDADLLVMTATPIPRSLALTLYGDLEVSVIDDLPPGRQPVRTVLRDACRREAIFAFVADQVAEGRQAYVVYPLVEESAKSDLRSAIEAWEELRGGPFRQVSVGLLHGRLAAAEKAATMAAFGRGELDVLVSTTVVEVGVDVPNATVMVVEHAERFGLAQLHQLRGRVGRGGGPSYCILVRYGAEAAASEAASARLRTLCETQNGFEIAERDLMLRGPGELFGVRQAGMPHFRVADLARDAELLRLARGEALAHLEDGES